MTSRNRSIGTVAIFLGTCMATIAISIINVALPAIQRDFHANITELQWVVGSYGLSMSAVMLSTGPLGDRFGRRRVWLIGVAVFVLGAIVAAQAKSLAMLITGCVVQGFAGALVIPGALSILTQAYPEPSERSRVIGAWASITGISLVISPVIGGILVDTFGWFSIFLINLPLGLLTLIFGRIGIKESADPDHAALDPAGQLLSILMLGSLTFALTEGGRSGWGAPLTLTGFAIAVPALFVFLIVESRVARPILPTDLFRNRNFAIINAAAFVLGFVGFTSLFFFSLFLQKVQGLSASTAGLYLMPIFLTMTLLASRFGAIAERFGMIAPMAMGFVAMSLAMLGMMLCSASSSYTLLLLMFLFLGLGMGLVFPANSASIMAITPSARTGSAAATLSAMRQSGMTIGIALLGSLMTSTSTRAISGGSSTLAAAEQGFHMAMLGAGLAAFAVAVLLFSNLPKQALTNTAD